MNTIINFIEDIYYGFKKNDDLILGGALIALGLGLVMGSIMLLVFN